MNKKYLVYGIVVALIISLAIFTVADTAWDVVSSTYETEIDISIQNQLPGYVFFKPDGTKMYTMGVYNKTVFQYSLSVAWNVSTATYDAKYKNVSSEDNEPYGLFFKPDGTEMYIVGWTNNKIFQYTLGTPWDVSTAAYNNLYADVSSEDVATITLFFKNDGSKLYVLGDTHDNVSQYSLSISWNVSTATYDDKSTYVGDECPDPIGLFFKSDGAKMYTTCYQKVDQYSLDTDWDISTTSYDNKYKNVSSEEGDWPGGLFFKPDGLKMYISGAVERKIFQYSLPDSPPTYTDNQTNTTTVGAAVNFSIVYDDDTTLHPNGQYNFSTNSTGVWVNSSTFNFTTTPQYAYNITTLNTTLGTTVGYRFYAFDNVLNWNNTPIYILTTTVPTVYVPSPTNITYNTSTIYFNATSFETLGDVIIINYNSTNATIDVNTTLTVEDGVSHHLLLYANTTAGYFGLNDSIYFSVDTTGPIFTINAPAANYATQTIPISITASDATALDVCYYNITREALTEVANTFFADVITQPMTDIRVVSSWDATYVFNVYCNDTSGNVNITNKTFTVILPAAGGAGGAAGIIIVGDEEAQWSMQTEDEATRYQLNLIQGAARTKDLLFENLGDTSRTIKLTCESVSGETNLCPYITFGTTSFELPLIKDIKIAVSFTIDIPDELAKGDYFANLVATDDKNNYGVITVEGNVETFNFIVLIFTKLISSKEIAGVKIPYFFIFLFTMFIAGFGSYFLILKPMKIPGGVATIVGGVFGFLLLIFI